MLLLSLFLIAFVSYFIWKPFLALAAPAAFDAKPKSRASSKRTSTPFQRTPPQDERPKQGYQGGEYIDFEEV